jgi:ApbE superfamily uncharacterized protein (UPF0280 family)
MTVQAALLPDGRRLHLNHGPIDAVIEGWGEPREVRAAYDQAIASFNDVLPTLVKELPTLRWPLSETAPVVQGAVARRMVAACWPFRNSFITPMAAVAGAVADHVLTAMLAGRTLSRAYVNDGGDIAFHLAASERLTCGVIGNVLAPAIGAGQATCDLPVRGIATARHRGTGGRSTSLGIAARYAFGAQRRRGRAHRDRQRLSASRPRSSPSGPTSTPTATSRRPPGGSGGRRPALDGDRSTFAHRLAEAERQRQAGLIYGAVLTLQGRFLVCGDRSKLMQAA